MLRVSLLGLILVCFSCGLVQPALAIRQLAAQDNWARYSPGETGLSLELPGEPKPYLLPIPQDVVEQVQDIKAYLYTGTKWIVLTNSFAIPKSWNLHSYAIGVVQGITDTKGVTDVQYSLEPGTPEKIPISGSYKMNGSAKVFNGFAVAKGSHIYMVTAVWPAADEALQAAAKRVLESVQFSLQ